MSTTVAAVTLPAISDVDRADDKLGSFMSDLDSFAHEANVFVGCDVSLDDAAFMARTGIVVNERVRQTDPATIARLLVFADETIQDLEVIRKDAEALRSDLLWAYRNNVIEPSGRRFARGADA